MKKGTQGVAIWDGYVAGGFRTADGSWAPNRTIVPDALWGRMKHRISLAGRTDEFKANAERLREVLTGHDVEIAVFRMWVEKLGIELPEGHYPGEKLWPWGRGWTQENLDSYLWPENGMEQGDK